MKERRITEEVIRFLATHIESVHTLEVLLLLFGGGDRAWSIEEVHASVKSSLGAAKTSLLGLAAGELVRPTSPDRRSFQYYPKSAEVDKCIRELAAAYAERSTAVIEIIYSHPIRTARTFSDAFDFRKKPEP